MLFRETAKKSSSKMGRGGDGVKAGPLRKNDLFLNFYFYVVACFNGH